MNDEEIKKEVKKLEEVNAACLKKQLEGIGLKIIKTRNTPENLGIAPELLMTRYIHSIAIQTHQSLKRVELQQAKDMLASVLDEAISSDSPEEAAQAQSESETKH